MTVFHYIDKLRKVRQVISLAPNLAGNLEHSSGRLYSRADGCLWLIGTLNQWTGSRWVKEPYNPMMFDAPKLLGPVVG